MDVRKKLVELLMEAPYNVFGNKLRNCYFDSCLELIADHLITHGVTVQELISVDDRLPQDGHTSKDVRRLLSIPADDVAPVVRCWDCKHCDPETYHCDHPMGTAAPLKRKPDDFCSYGDRKEND